VQNSTTGAEENQGLGLERETGIEPATLSLGIAPAARQPLARDGKPRKIARFAILPRTLVRPVWQRFALAKPQ